MQFLCPLVPVPVTLVMSLLQLATCNVSNVMTDVLLAQQLVLAIV